MTLNLLFIRYLLAAQDAVEYSLGPRLTIFELSSGSRDGLRFLFSPKRKLVKKFAIGSSRGSGSWSVGDMSGGGGPAVS